MPCNIREAFAMIPNIPIPRSPRYNANQDRYGVPDGPTCLICAKPIKRIKAARTVILADDLGAIIDPSRWDREDHGGCFYVGVDCWDRHPEIHRYEVKELRGVS